MNEPDYTPQEKILRALKVITLTEETNAWLTKNDPQALNQCLEAIESYTKSLKTTKKETICPLALIAFFVTDHNMKVPSIYCRRECEWFDHKKDGCVIKHKNITVMPM